MVTQAQQQVTFALCDVTPLWGEGRSLSKREELLVFSGGQVIGVFPLWGKPRRAFWKGQLEKVARSIINGCLLSLRDVSIGEIEGYIDTIKKYHVAKGLFDIRRIAVQRARATVSE